MIRGVLGTFFFFQAEDGIRDLTVTGVQTCALPILLRSGSPRLRWVVPAASYRRPRVPQRGGRGAQERGTGWSLSTGSAQGPTSLRRSEERRVGKEGRSRWSPDH